MVRMIFAYATSENKIFLFIYFLYYIHYIISLFKKILQQILDIHVVFIMNIDLVTNDYILNHLYLLKMCIQVWRAKKRFMI